MIAAVIKPRGPMAGTNSPKLALVNAKEAWGEAVPDWVFMLATACDRTSQNAVAKQLGYSGSVISAVLKHSYIGGYDNVEKTVRGALMAETLDCPVLGDLPQHICLRHQKHAMNGNPTSSMRVQLSRMCRGGCIHSRLPNKNGGQHAE